MVDYDPQAGRDMPVEEMFDVADEEIEEHHVVTAVQNLARLVADVDDVEAVLARIAGLVVSAVPGADGAGVTLMRATDPPTVLAWSVTDPFVREVDHLQYDICREGPCLTAMGTRRTLVSGSIGSDRRWPRFGGRVARLNVHSALSLPLIVQGEVVGALNIYARVRDAFSEKSVALAEQFAGPAAVSVGNLQVLQAAHARAESLQTALTNRAVIDQAIGIIRSRSGGTAEEAFGRMRKVSQSDNVKVVVVAQRLVDEAVRRAHARNGQAGRDADVAVETPGP